MVEPSQRKRLAFVVPVYNVSRYLPDFIDSLNRQVGGTDQLEIIAVDDGSTDDSLAVLNEWAARHPDLLTVLSKANGGLCSARNFGIPHVKAEWVGFADPDDMLDKNYLATVSRFLERHPDVSMIATNMLRFDEISKRIRGGGLSYRFASGDRVVDIQQSPNYFQMSVASAFLRADSVKQLGLEFDGRVQPCWDDSHFNTRYLLEVGTRIGFVSNAHYLYRIRADGTALTSGEVMDPLTYTAVPRYGHLDCLIRAKEKCGQVPRWLQNLIIYDISFKFAGAEPQESTVAAGGIAAEYLRLLRLIRDYLEDDVIDKFCVRQLPRHVLEILLHLNEPSWSSPYAVVDRCDVRPKQTRLSYLFKGETPNETVFADGERVQIDVEENRPLRYFDETLMTQRIAWLPASRSVEVIIDGDRLDILADWPSARARSRLGMPLVHTLAKRTLQRGLALARSLPLRFRYG